MIRRGACRALVHWFTNHYRDFSKDSKLKKTLLEFQAWALENDPPSKNNLVGYLVKMLDKKNDKGTYTSLFPSFVFVFPAYLPILSSLFPPLTPPYPLLSLFSTNPIDDKNANPIFLRMY